ncbi:acetolactate synthase small subunit [Neisseriaceae bacterium PsAf]|nr:acetolactate synthase small subunit [Neisseriaceae bacterium PsAf]MCV2502840.1 acetolactate synthase small subunit [Neisseriaceae bacterium]
MRHVISILMENESGALSRVVGLFSARGYNIDSLSVNVTDDKTLSRLTLTTQGDERMIEQILKQLNKLIEVVKVCDLNESRFTERELILIKIRTTAKDRKEFLELIQIYRGNVVDVTERTLTAEITGTSDKVDSFIGLIGQTSILEIVRTGAIGLGRGERTMKV